MTHPDALVRLLPTEYDGFFFGRNVHHDPRSRNFAFAGAPTGKSTRWAHNGPILNQLSTGSCTGNAMVGSLMSGNLWNGSWAFTEDDARSVYSRATQIDPFPGEWPPTDTGSDGVSVCTVAQERGWIVSYEHTFDFDTMCAAIEAQPCLFGFPVYENFVRTGADGMVPPPSGNVVGGHEVALIEVDYGRQLIGFVNSWGDGWGAGGYAWFSFAMIRNWISGGMLVDCTVPKVAAAPPPQPGPLSLSVEPNHGEHGTQFTVAGSGLTPGATINLAWNDPSGSTAGVVADGRGGFSVVLSVPNYLTPGAYHLTADDSTHHATATFTVDGTPQPPEPNMTLTPADLDAIDKIVAKQIQAELVKALRLEGVSGAADPRNAVVKAIVDHGDATWKK